MLILPTTLSLAAAAAVINVWLISRVIRLRLSGKVTHGDGGQPLLLQRMRAHANFAENAPLTLLLIAGIEVTGKGGTWLAITGAVFMLARILHAFGMDNAGPNRVRATGMVTTLAIQLGLAAMAVLIALGRF